jgi:hypothetical protein
VTPRQSSLRIDMSADDAAAAPPPPLAHATAFDDIENSSTHSNSGRSTPVTRDKQRDFLTLQRVESQSLRREVDAVGASEVRRASSSMTMRGVFCRECARDDANGVRVAREVREARGCRLAWFPRDETTRVVDAMRCDDALTR